MNNLMQQLEAEREALHRRVRFLYAEYMGEVNRDRGWSMANEDTAYKAWKRAEFDLESWDVENAPILERLKQAQAVMMDLAS